jgi:arylsulfatase A
MKYGEKDMKLCRREFIRMTGLTLSGCLAAGRQAVAGEENRKPNIVLIMVDDLGAEGIECYGGKTNKAPRIGALAAAGMRFENAFSQPICGPTRACIMTGRYPFRSGVATNHGTKGFSVPWGRGEKPEITFAHLMKEQGYATAIAGKWALCHFDKTPNHVTDCGFEKYRMWPKIYRDKLTLRYWNPASFQDGVYHSKIEGVYGPDHECDYLIEFMRNNKDRPFLVYYPMTLVHDPLQAPPGSKEESIKDRKKRLIMLHRLNVEYVDRLVGRLTDAVDKLGLAEKTLIIFTSDNGTHRRIPSLLGDRKIRGGKGKVFDAGTRVPFVARWTGVIKPGRVLEDLVDFSDILPSFAELSGAQVPTDRVIDGRSFAPQLRGEKGKPREWVYLQNGEKKAVRGKKWQVSESGELFDLSDRYNPVLVKPGEGGSDAEAARKRLTAALESIK